MPINDYTIRYYRVQCDDCGEFLPAVGAGFKYLSDAKKALLKAGWQFIPYIGRHRVKCPKCQKKVFAILEGSPSPQA